MYLRLFIWEAYVETVPPSKKFLDWDFTPSENHIWVWRFHVLWNRRKGTRTRYGTNDDEIPSPLD